MEGKNDEAGSEEFGMAVRRSPNLEKLDDV